MAHLDITLQIRPQDRATATDVFRREPLDQDVVVGLEPLLEAAPESRVRTAH